MEITGFSGPICATGSSPSTLLDAKDEKDFISFLKKKKQDHAFGKRDTVKGSAYFTWPFSFFVLPRRHLKMAPASFGNILLTVWVELNDLQDSG